MRRWERVIPIVLALLFVLAASVFLYKWTKRRVSPEPKLYEIVDESYSLMSAGRKGMVESHGISLRNRRFEIIAENCDLPASGLVTTSTEERNDCLLRDVDNYEVVFTQKRFIRPLSGTCPHCGEAIKAP